MFRKIAILGPGLLGASLLQAARQRGLAAHLAAWSRRAGTRQRCAGQPWCDSVHDTPADCVRGADLVVACVPVDKIGETLADAAPALEPGTLVTDVGSTKTGVCRQAEAVLPPQVSFVGAHPMAGSEKSGLEHATPALFENRLCFITPLATTPAPALDKATQFWRALGMQTVVTTPAEHDAIVAHVSHLPHFMAAVLTATLQGRPETWRDFGGPGLRDTTRVAGGDPALWSAIAEENRVELLRALDAFQGELDILRAALDKKDFTALQNQLTRGKTWRDGLAAQ